MSIYHNLFFYRLSYNFNLLVFSRFYTLTLGETFLFAGVRRLVSLKFRLKNSILLYELAHFYLQLRKGLQKIAADHTFIYELLVNKRGALAQQHVIRIDLRKGSKDRHKLPCCDILLPGRQEIVVDATNQAELTIDDVQLLSYLL